MDLGASLRIEAKLPQNHSIIWKGLNLVVQWPKGTMREGKDKDGKTWRREMKADYGFIDDTSAKGNQENLDIYIGDDRRSDGVFVIEQLKEDGKTFDEYKLVAGVPSLEAALELYLAHYPKGWGENRVGDCYETNLGSLRKKVEEHQEDRPENGKSVSLEGVGRQWDSLGQFNLRLGWLRTQAHIYKDWMMFARPWIQLTDEQKTKVTARVTLVSEPGYNRKEANLIRKLNGGKAGAIEKVVRILGSNGIGSLIVGGVAVQEYGYARNTKDTDLVVMDVGKARGVLLRNGYKEGNEDWDVFDPEFGEEIELLQGDSKVMFGNVPMPMPQEVNIHPKFCNLPTLLDLKIEAYTNSEMFEKIHGIRISGRHDQADTEVLIANNQLPRDFLRGKHNQKEYERLWDWMHGSSQAGDETQGDTDMNKTAADANQTLLDKAGTKATGFYHDGPATCMDCVHRTPHSKDASGEERDSCSHPLVKQDSELQDKKLPDGTIEVDADDWCMFARKPQKEGKVEDGEGESRLLTEGEATAKASGQHVGSIRQKQAVWRIYLEALATMSQK